MRILNVTETYARAARESAGSCRRPGAQRASSNSRDSRLGIGKTRSGNGREKHIGMVAVRMATKRKQGRDDLSANLAALPASELEPGGQAFLRDAAGRLRHRAHFRTVRFAGSCCGRGLPGARHPLRGRTHRHVYPDCAKPVAEAHLSRYVGNTNAPSSKRRCGYFGAGNRRTGVRRSPASEDRHAAKWSGGARIVAGAWSVSQQA